MTASRGVLDTSVFIASESGRPLRAEALPAESATTVITIAELRLGVLAASDLRVRARRLTTLERVAQMPALHVDDAAASAWAQLRLQLRERNLRMNVNDLWIAAIAMSKGLPIVTQDAVFDALAEIDGIDVIRV